MAPVYCDLDKEKKTTLSGLFSKNSVYTYEAHNIIITRKATSDRYTLSFAMTTEMEETFHLIANFLSIIIICSCLYMKVPQILHIIKFESIRGISTAAVMMEMLGYTFMSTYNFQQGYSILTYVEYPVILMQLYVVLFYTLKLKNLLKNPIIKFLIATYFSIITAFIWGYIPAIIYPYLVPISTPLSGFSKIAYVYGIIRARNSESVSLTTWVISAGTNIGRIFTIIMDSGDSKLIFNLTVSALLSASVLFTALSYKFPKFPRQNRTPLNRQVE